MERFSNEGWDVLLTVRDHAQTLELARRRWPDVLIIGGQSPPGIASKGLSIMKRAEELRRFAKRTRPDVALSHGSHAQAVGARAAGIPVISMMDYEYQPANHVSFRFADRVIVPSVFPSWALRRYGVAERKVVRYSGFKEDLYLAGFRPDDRVVEELRLDPAGVIAVMRPPPDGALYHRRSNRRFDELLEFTIQGRDVQIVLLPRNKDQALRYQSRSGVRVPTTPVDGLSLLACADLTIGAGGTMNRESALLGTPTYTVFSGRLAAVDAELMRAGRLHDLRHPDTYPVLTKKPSTSNGVPRERARKILETVMNAVSDMAGSR